MVTPPRRSFGYKKSAPVRKAVEAAPAPTPVPVPAKTVSKSPRGAGFKVKVSGKKTPQISMYFQ